MHDDNTFPPEREDGPTVYFDRSRHKPIHFSDGEDRVELGRHSEDAAKRLISETLETLREAQLARDREWRRIMALEDDGDSAT